MKAAIILPLLLLSLSIAPSSNAATISPEQMNLMIDMSVNQMKAEGEFANMASCTNQSEAKVESVFRSVMRTCVEKHMQDEDDEKTTACLVENFSGELGVSAETFTACSEQSE